MPLFFQHLAIQRLPRLETLRCHARRRTHGVARLHRFFDDERPEFAPEKSSRVKRFQFGLFALIEALPDHDERRNHRVARPEFLRDPRTEMRRSHRLRRLVACVPVELMPRVQNIPEVCHDMRTNERAAIHHLPDFLQPFGKLDAVQRRRSRLERREHRRRFSTHGEGREALRIERLGVRHAARHP